mmetsp:Transcript_4739/g.13950  ORF Transcript_4739/g.13950 Transcript_4739/m.13950 type:complete len:313 (+) Transcript_4739:704-1642(+)
MLLCNTARCPARWREIEHDDGTWSLYISRAHKHSVHGYSTQKVRRCRGGCMPRVTVMQAHARAHPPSPCGSRQPPVREDLLTPNERMNFTKRDACGYLREKGCVLTAADQKAVGSFLKRVKKVLNDVPGDAANTYAGIEMYARSNTKEKLVEDDVWSQHAPYTILFEVDAPPNKTVWFDLNARNIAARRQKQADGTCDDAEEGCRILVVFSTENLLLNAYQQQICGMPCLMCVDFTHRLTFEGFNMCMIGTISPSQHYKCIGFAVTSDESETTHVKIFRALRHEIESIVLSRLTRQLPAEADIPEPMPEADD